MAKLISRKQMWFFFSIIGFFISSATVWFIPLVSFDGELWQRIAAYILGASFWLGLIAGFAFLVILNLMRRKEKHRASIPFIWFFRNKIALVFDIALVIGLAGVIVMLFVDGLNQWMSAGILFTFIFSLEMHGMFNGENYKFVSGKKKILYKIKQEGEAND